MKTFLLRNAVRTLNALELLFLIVVLITAFFFQFVLKELPCPLCLLQRIGMLGICIGFLLNLRFGLKPSHYALVLLSALFTAFVALRQIALHIVPGSGSYGSAILGFHMYTWSFIISMLIIIATTILLSCDREYLPALKITTRWKHLIHLLFAVVFIISIMNVESTYRECGWQQCPDM